MFLFRKILTGQQEPSTVSGFPIWNLSNKERLDKVQESGQALLKAKPEMSELVSPKIEDLSNQFDKLEKDTH